MVAANVASIEELLALEMTGPEYLSLLADALSDGGDASAAATLESIAGAVDAGLTVTLGDILDVTAGASDAAFDAQLNALDMLSIGAQVARGDAAITINPLGITVPGSRRPRRRCGSSRRRASRWGRRGVTAPENGIPPCARGRCAWRSRWA
jgi:uncharacterized membrane protein